MCSHSLRVGLAVLKRSTKMKILSALAILGLLQTTCFAQKMIESLYLNPKDLGFDKRMVTAKLEKNQVMIITLAMDLENAKQWVSSVHFDGSGDVSAPVMIVDRSVLDKEQKGVWSVSVPGTTTGLVDLSMLTSKYGGRGNLEYVFHPLGDRGGFRSLIVVSVEITSYAEAQERGAELPEMVKVGGWTASFGNTFVKGEDGGWMNDVEWIPKELLGAVQSTVSARSE